jgi:hypothetical protein
MGEVTRQATLVLSYDLSRITYGFSNELTLYLTILLRLLSRDVYLITVLP